MGHAARPYSKGTPHGIRLQGAPWIARFRRRHRHQHCAGRHTRRRRRRRAAHQPRTARQRGAQWLANQIKANHGFVKSFGAADNTGTAYAVIGMRAAGVDKPASDMAINYLRTKIGTQIQLGGSDSPGALAEYIMAAVADNRGPRHFGGTGAQNNLVTRLVCDNARQRTRHRTVRRARPDLRRRVPPGSRSRRSRRPTRAQAMGRWLPASIGSRSSSVRTAFGPRLNLSEQIIMEAELKQNSKMKGRSSSVPVKRKEMSLEALDLCEVFHLEQLFSFPEQGNCMKLPVPVRQSSLIPKKAGRFKSRPPCIRRKALMNSMYLEILPSCHRTGYDVVSTVSEAVAHFKRGVCREEPALNEEAAEKGMGEEKRSKVEMWLEESRIIANTFATRWKPDTSSPAGAAVLTSSLVDKHRARATVKLNQYQLAYEHSPQPSTSRRHRQLSQSRGSRNTLQSRPELRSKVRMTSANPKRRGRGSSRRQVFLWRVGTGA